MNKRSPGTIAVLSFALALSAFFLPNTGRAATLYVATSTAACSGLDPCYTTIQAAVNAAVSGDTVLVKPGTYSERITLKSGIVLSGTETALAILTGGGSGTIITANNVASQATVSNFTFLSASTGIQVSNNSVVKITNNIFWLGTGGTAVAVTNSTSTATSVVNNTFYQNGTAVSRGLSETIANNIFSNNSLAISTTDISGYSFNCFYANSSNGITLDINNDVSTDPLLVNPVNSDKRDFHLKGTSPCINTGSDALGGTDKVDGTQNDMGAYGGGASDIIPRQVFDLSVTGSTANSITINWSPNNCYLITTDNAATPGNPRGYKVYYGSSGTGDYDGSGGGSGSPVTIDLKTVAVPPYTLSGLTPGAATPSTPTLNSVSPFNERLEVKWSPVSGATGYKVWYGLSSPPTIPIDVGNVNSYVISGLTNGTDYYVAVSAYAQTTYYLAVTAYDNTNQTLTPGVSHESAYSAEVTEQIGGTAESGLSTAIPEKPDFVTPNPSLPNTGCFIATAAYGHYSAPQVRALRAFRDRYLLSNAPGRGFVRWYYKHGPALAQLMNDYPRLKPFVRTALMPAVGFAIITTGTTTLTQVAVSLLFLLGTVAFFSWRMRQRIAASPGNETHIVKRLR